jgi:hypothetical protein
MKTHLKTLMNFGVPFWNFIFATLTKTPYSISLAATIIHDSFWGPNKPWRLDDAPSAP